MKYTLIAPNRYDADDCIVEARDMDELEDKAIEFCERNSVPRFELDIVSEAESLREYAADMEFDQMR